MSAHRSRLPRAGGRWTKDPDHAGLRHRGGHAWEGVRIPCRIHVCAPQSALVWTLRSKQGRHHAAVLWCACGAVTYPGLGGQWIARNMRRHRSGAEFPAWHRSLVYLDQPAKAYARLAGAEGVSDVDAVSGGWRRVGRDRVAAGGALVRPADASAHRHSSYKGAQESPCQRRIA